MKRMVILLRHSLWRRRGLISVTLVLLFVFQIFMILAARALELSGKFAQIGSLMPEFIRVWTNMTAPSFGGFVSFGYSHPIVLLFLIAMAITIGTEPATEIESRFVDLLMARPLSRNAVILRSAVLLIVTIAAAMGSMLLGTVIGLHLLAPPSARIPSTSVIEALALNLAAIVLAWGGIALAIGAISRRRANAAAIAGLSAFSMFVLDYVGRFWDAVAGISRLSPFHYYSPFQLIGGTPLPLRDVAVLLSISVAGFLIAVAAYARRDL